MPGGNQASFRNALRRDCLVCINNSFHRHSTFVCWLGNKWVQKKINGCRNGPMGFPSDRRPAMLSHKYMRHCIAQYPHVPTLPWPEGSLSITWPETASQTSLPPPAGPGNFADPPGSTWWALHLQESHTGTAPGRPSSLPASPEGTSAAMSYLQRYSLTRQQRESGGTGLQKRLLEITSLKTWTTQWQELTQATVTIYSQEWHFSSHV